ncbi:winged helix-turn-helix domain-containing protein [Rhizobium brockwellii]|uniref:ATP-binding protein n=1 Tax=Rhizobium brockwellii TaxID=3019932 RepID=UPI003F9E264F
MDFGKRSDVIDFGPFRLHLKQRVLRVGEQEVRLGGRPMEILLALARNKGEVVTKKELFAAAWPGIAIEDGNLKVTVAFLRRSLRKYAPSGNYIRTFSSRGYWLAEELEQHAPEGEPQISAAPPAFPNPRTIVGRAEDIAEVRRIVAVNRLATIVGAGGIGKTTVALAVADLASQQDGVPIVFLDLSRIAGEEFVIPTLAAMLGVSSGSQDRLDAICSLLATRAVFLVLDTCEHVSNAVALLCEVVLSRTANVRILATSRQVLRVRNEKVLWLSPLAVPPAGHRMNAKQILEYSAPRLLVQRATQMGDYSFEDKDSEVVAEICRRLDGLPLAIELIASLLPGSPAVDILAELDDRFGGLTRGGEDGPPRQRTLLATLEWSYALLSGAEAAVLRASSIFAGPFEVGALLSVVSHEDLDPTSVFDAFAGLRSKSMLYVEQISDELHYRLLDSTRAFAASLLADCGELERVSSAYAKYVQAFFEKARSERTLLPVQQWYATYATRVEELRKAITWALDSRGDTMLGLQLVATAFPIWHELSMIEEASRNSAKALAEFQRIGCLDGALKLKLLVGFAAVTRYISTDTEKAIETFEEAISLSREIGDQEAECQALVTLASYRLLPGYRTAALETLRQLEKVALRSNNRPALWEHETLLAEMEIIRSDYPHVIARLEKLRRALRNAPNGMTSRFGGDLRVRTESTLGAAQWLGSRKPGTGLRRVRTAAQWALDAHHGWTLIFCFTRGILFILSECEDFALARLCTGKLKEAIDRYGVPSWNPVANCYSEALESLSGSNRDPSGIISAFEGLRGGLPQHGRHVYYALLVRALYAMESGDEACRILDYVFEIGPQQSMLPELLRLRAAGERWRGRDDTARETLKLSLEVADAHGSWAWQLRAATDLAVLLRDNSQLEDALAILQPIYYQFEDGFETPDLKRAEDVLSELTGFAVARGSEKTARP